MPNQIPFEGFQRHSKLVASCCGLGLVTLAALWSSVLANSFKTESIGMIIFNATNTTIIDHRRPITNVKRVVGLNFNKESCDIQQPPVLANDPILNYVKPGKFNTWMFYDDQTYQVVIEKSGALVVNWVSGADPLNTTNWVQLQDPTPQKRSNF